MRRFREWLCRNVLHVETGILIVVSIALLISTLYLTAWTVRSSLVSDQAAADIKASLDSLSQVKASVEAIDAHASSFVTGLNGIETLLRDELVLIDRDLSDTKDALEEAKQDIAEIRKDVEDIRENVDDIESLLEH